jgi:hypothetical protein
MNDYINEARMFLNLAIESVDRVEIEKAIDQATVALSILNLILHEQQRFSNK